MKSSRAFALALLLFVPVIGAAAPAELVVFSGADETPFALFVGDKGGWSVPVQAGPFASNAKRVRVEDTDAPGVRRFSWNGKGEGQVYFAGRAPVDMSELGAARAALVVVLKIHSGPRRSVTMRMGCGYPCAADADLTQIFKRLPREEWLRLDVDLECFVSLGARLEAIDTPFVLLTSGKLSVSIADVRVVPGAGEDAAVSC